MVPIYNVLFQMCEEGNVLKRTFWVVSVLSLQTPGSRKNNKTLFLLTVI